MAPDNHRPPAPASQHTSGGVSVEGTRQLIDTEAQIDMAALRAYRLGRLRGELKRRDYAGILLYDPINIRYATGARNMTVWTLHNAVRYCFVATEGPVVMFEFHSSPHLPAGLETIDEIRTAVYWFYFGAGQNGPERVKLWAAELAELVRRHGGGNRRLAVDKCDFLGVDALRAEGLEVMDGQEVTELARRIKSREELACMEASIAVAEAGMAEMQEALRPGLSENELWSILHQVNIAHGGEWIETRLLASGPRTNPWFQECSDRMIRPSELVAFDTDLIGPYSYCADISRTYFCGPGRPSDEQRRLYRLAWEQIHTNIALLKPGLSYRELAERSWQMPAGCAGQRYSVVVHGVGLCDEYPACYYTEDWSRDGYDGLLETGMTICVESYIGEDGGHEGVKLEQQVLITETGAQVLSNYPFEDDLLGREV
jgi:Xaa-Pro aminopeptidase